jgi:hypothetical protein
MRRRRASGATRTDRPEPGPVGGPPSGRMTERGSPYTAQCTTGKPVASPPRIPLRRIQATPAAGWRLP